MNNEKFLFRYDVVLLRDCRGRERLIKFLRSHPVQTFLCAIVLVDASIVIAQILLDINSVKGQSMFLAFSLNSGAVAEAFRSMIECLQWF